MNSLDDTIPAHQQRGPAWVTGAMAGRFIIVDTLGSGGMGTVYSAYDPVLDRKVALKTLSAMTDFSGEELGARLVREAQAMARVQHPNVCTVHDIGSVGDRVFVAMEQVDGQTLRTWMETPRPWREVLRMFVAAGRGLAAAHEAGLVHRDFKPENVLVGRDGRPRVSDFGLVSLLMRRDDGNWTSGLTIPRAGTPGYMSPEQILGEPTDARSDQFSFCVALWEALHGEPPFAYDADAHQRRPPDKPRRKVPASLTLAIARGLATRPDERWPSMHALLTALEQEPATLRRRLARVALVPLALLSLGALARLRPQAGEPCDGAARLSGVWDEASRRRIEAAFVASGVPGARAVWLRVRDIVDGYAQRWVGTYEEACRATHVEGRQSSALLDLRMSCLDRRRNTLAELTAMWTSGGGDGESIERAASAAASLDGVDECSDARALSEPLGPPRDAPTLRKVNDLRARMDRLRALLATARFRDARRAAEALQPAADAAGYAPVQAEARLLLGEALDHLGDPAAAAALEEAAHLGAAAHDDALAARALILLVRVLSNDAARFERALGLVPAAAAFVARAGDPPELRGRLLVTRGQALLDAGQAADAEELMVEAVPLLRRSLGPIAHETMWAELVLAGAANARGDYDTARAVCQQLLDGYARVDGPDSPAVANVLTDLAMVESDSGHYERARVAYERALLIREKSLGPDNTEVATLLVGLGNLDFFAERFDAAAARYQKAIAIFEHVLAPDHGYLALAYGNLGAARRGQGRLREALALGEKSVALARRAYGPRHPQLALMQQELAATLRGSGDARRARAVAEEAIAIFAAAQSAPDVVGAARFELAQDLWQIGLHERARAIAEVAAAELRNGGASGASLKKIEAWIESVKPEGPRRHSKELTRRPPCSRAQSSC